MSRKTLLTEAEVRQFLKLANLGSIGDARIQEMGGYGMPGKRDEDDPDEMREQEDDLEMGGELEGGEDLEMDVELGDEGGEEDLEMDMDMDAEGGEDRTVDVEDFEEKKTTAQCRHQIQVLGM